MTQNITVVTAASSPKFHDGLFQFLESLHANAGTPFHCIVYDLGLDDMVCLTLRIKWPKVELRKFDFSKYPEYYNVKVQAGQYAWKPAILHEVASGLSGGILLWCDSFNKVVHPLTHIISVTSTKQIYTPISSGNIKKWTHPGMLHYMHLPLDHSILQYPNRNGALVSFSLDTDGTKSFIEKWATLANIRECIAPEGSDRSNHRQDQSLLTLLYYDYVLKRNITPEDRYVSVSIHNYINGVCPHNY